MSKYRIVPAGETLWAVQRRKWLFFWDMCWSSFLSESEAEEYIEQRLGDDEEEKRRKEVIAGRRRDIVPRVYPD